MLDSGVDGKPDFNWLPPRKPTNRVSLTDYPTTFVYGFD